MLKGSLLHVGCGGEKLPYWMEDCEETRLDIEERSNPDIVADMTDMGEIGEYDLLYTCHALEHLYPHDVKKALKEFLRVLKVGGTAIVIVPNIENVKPTKDVLYESAAGPVCGMDVLYGMASLIEQCPYMAHKTGFTEQLLIDELKEAGFVDVVGKSIDIFQSIMVCGKKGE